ncbi:MAG: transporter substrate-binding domain-containing protein [Clostridia bacterium]|nr:transporter substrate-binding domain-containing protein [Clostridia bacterium]
MKKFIAALLAAALCLTMCASALAETRLEKILASGEIHMATSPDFAPNEFIDDSKTGQDQYVGSDIELAKYIAEKLGVKLVVDAMDFSAVQAAVTTGNTDMAIAGFAYTEERAEACGTSTFYNMSNKEDGKNQGLLVLKENADQYTKAEDFSGKKVATQNASLQYQLTTTQLPEAQVELVSDLGTAVMMLTSGKVDAVAVDADNGDLFCHNYDEVAMSEFYFDYSSDGNILLVTKGEDDLLAAINEILDEVNEQGLYQQWREEATELAKSLGLEVDE